MIETVPTNEKKIPQLSEVSRTEISRIKMSYEEYLEFVGDAPRIIEWVDGESIVYIPPNLKHQDIVVFLNKLLGAYVDFLNLGKLLVSPFEVKLWPDGPSREPDILFIANESIATLTPKRFEGGPDLLIEVVSPSSATEDRVRKFGHYEQAAVREYWIIDPRPKQQHADFYALDSEGKYQPIPLTEEGIMNSTVLPEFWLNVS